MAQKSAKIIMVSLTFLAALGGGMIGAWFSASPATANNQATLIAGELRLTDENGKTRLLLTMLREKPRLLMLDQNGEYRLEMGLGETGEPHIWLRDNDGAAKIQVSLTATGKPSLSLSDHRGNERAIWALSDEGDPTIIFKDRNNKDRIAMWYDEKNSGLALANKNGYPIASLSAKKNEAAKLLFFDSKD